MRLKKAAPSDLLEELSTYNDTEVQRNVTLNPNASIETLFKLGASNPEALINNPVFELLMLEKPRLLSDMPVETLISLLKLPDIPEEYLAYSVDYRKYDEYN